MSDSNMLTKLKQLKPGTEYPTRLGKPWSTDEDKQLLEELEKSESIENIAKSHKRTEGGIVARQKILVKQFHKQNIPIDEIAQLVRLDESKISEILEKNEKNEKNEKVLNISNVSTQAKQQLNKSDLSQVRDELVKLNQNFERLIEILIQKR